MRRTPTLRRAAAALATVSALAALSACNDDDSDSTATDDSTASTTADVGLTSALSDLDEGDEVDPSDFVDTISDGLESSTTAKTTMTMSMGDTMSMSGDGVLDYTTTPAEMQMTMSMDMGAQSLDYDTRLVDGVIYIKMGDLTGGKFLKMDPDDPDGPLAGMGMGGMLDQSDPIGMLESLESSISTVVYDGEDDVDGRTLDHYELTIDPKAAMEEMMPSAGADLGSAVPDSISYDIWLDDENRFSHMEMEMPIMGQSMTMEMSLTDWGTDVDIEAPAADEITEDLDMGSMTGGVTAG